MLNINEKENMTRGHVISSSGKWAVIKSQGSRALRVFEQREIAFYYAVHNFDLVIVHNTKGEVDFQMMKSVMDVKLKLKG